MGPDREDTVAGNAGAAAPLDLPIIPGAGVVIDHRFEIISFLGSGSMSSVYKAKHLLMDRLVALKFLHEDLATDGNAMERFRRECRAVSVLQHPNIVNAYGSGVFGRLPYFAMEYLEGLSLAALLRQKQRLTFDEAKPIFSQILAGLAHAHEKGIIHRDLKPSNVMIFGPENQVKLLDFGIAKILPESGMTVETITNTGCVFGTALYMSPEQCRGARPDARSDVYAMGCLMYEVLDGNPPLEGDTPYATVAKHLNEPPRESEYITGNLRSVILAALEKDPRRRLQSAAELKEALSDAAAWVRLRSESSGAENLSTSESRHAGLAGLSRLALSAALLALFGTAEGC
jgi:eukaryotic-like serine/threonine-protein kinase